MSQAKSPLTEAAETVAHVFNQIEVGYVTRQVVRPGSLGVLRYSMEDLIERGELAAAKELAPLVTALALAEGEIGE